MTDWQRSFKALLGSKRGGSEVIFEENRGLSRVKLWFVLPFLRKKLFRLEKGREMGLVRSCSELRYQASEVDSVALN